MKPILKVEYFIEDDKMSDDEYQNQEFKCFTITEEMILEIVENNVKLEKGQTICNNNFFIMKA